MRNLRNVIVWHIRRLVVVPLGIFVANALAQGPPNGESNEPADYLQQLQHEAAAVGELVKTAAAKEFLAACTALPPVDTRVIYRDRKRRLAYTEREAAELTQDERDRLERREYGADVYYGAFGTPVIYARPLDILADEASIKSFGGKRILDFGYGMLGQLRMLASVGADAAGVDVHPLLRALYKRPHDQGVVEANGVTGRVTVIDGRFPGDADVRKRVGDGYDLIISKNVLKYGYIHPERDVDPRYTVQLGVDDETFVRALADILKPGGYVLIYNLAPAQNPPDKPYLPHANGKCPFDRRLIERTGFHVLAFDADDSQAAHEFWLALGLHAGPRDTLPDELFAHYTLLRRADGRE